MSTTTRVGGLLVAASALAGSLLLKRGYAFSAVATPFSLALVTSPNMTHAKELAAKLVNAKLAACVNILPAVHSVYMWQGVMQTVSIACICRLY